MQLKDIDFQQLFAKGISEFVVEKQKEQLKKGFNPIFLIKPALISNGIISLSEEQQAKYLKIAAKTQYKVTIFKFVPASGAASRMFKHLYEYLNVVKQSQDKQDTIIKEFPQAKELIYNLNNFAFYDKLQNCIAESGFTLKSLLEQHRYDVIFELILEELGLNYGFLPKALIDFHKYHDEVRKAFEEHLVEGALYAQNSNDLVNVYFTISPEHEVSFKESLQAIVSKYEKRFGVTYNIEYSFQHKSTDTIALDLNDELLRDENGKLVFRPGGHGALLQNLQELDADIVFIKNIDNITVDNRKELTIKYKKLLLGFLMEKRQMIFDYILKLKNNSLGDKELAEILNFIRIEMQEEISVTFSDLSFLEKQKYLLQKLNRPIRVCGMVKNEGEPGGGPFFAKNSKGEISLQIVEGAQVDMSDENQRLILSASTHFNPVDIVASITNVEGEKFHLQNFVDENSYIVTQKSIDGKIIKALELPGLWNGSMADWITFFVEVPIETFSPVKEINDLLRKEHLVK